MKLTPHSFFKGYFRDINLNLFFKYTDAGNNTDVQQAELNKLGFNTFGGYGEHRGDMFKDTYLEKGKKFTHLGIDINLSKGTLVYCPFDCEVVDLLIDKDIDIGWGVRVVLKKRDCEFLLVIGHLELDFIYPFRQKRFHENTILAKVGSRPTNGNVFEHIHVQAIKEENLKNFDGYGQIEDLINNPNPFEIEW